MAWYKVADADLQTAGIKAVKAGGKNICLVYDKNQYFATQLYCPHAGADLNQGKCENGKLICPYHRYTYDLQTGKGGEGQGDYVNTYAVTVRDNEVFVQISTWAEKLKRFFIKKED